MPALSREQAAAVLTEGHAALESLFEGLSEPEMIRPATDGGWSPKDLLGHIAFWEELALTAVREFRGSLPLSIEKIFADGQTSVDAANDENHRVSLNAPLADVRLRSASIYSDLLAVIHGLSDTEWRAKVTGLDGRKRPLVELLGSILGAPKRPFGHAFAHVEEFAPKHE